MSEPQAHRTVATDPRLDWFHQARFGMFIHWGCYAVPARGEWLMDRERIDPASYTRFAEAFTAAAYDPVAWARLAVRAGCRYMVLTCRHHDGYCLWDSQLSDFTATRIGPGRDLVAEYAAACRAAGLRVGFYYSLKDWRHPDYFAGHRGDAAGHRAYLDYVHGQVEELLTGYGQVDLLWYDGPSPYDAAGWEAARLNDRARQLQPGILINDRSRLPEDFDTPEQHVKASPPDRAWETCLTTNSSWGYHAGDTTEKPTDQLLGTLVQTAGGGGNLLLNIGPRADGGLPGASVARFEAIGDWLATNGEAIYGSERTGFQWAAFGLHTQRDHELYCHLRRYPGQRLVVPGVASKVTAARLLGGGELDWRQQGSTVTIDGLPEQPVGVLPVVRLTCAEPPRYQAGGPNLGWPEDAHVL